MSSHAPSINSNILESTTDISVQLKRLRRLRTDPRVEPSSLHLKLALDEARREPQGKQPEVSYIFIGISIPSSPASQ
jgi:hypothetical protein